MRFLVSAFALLLCWSGPLAAGDGNDLPGDPIAPIILGVTSMLAFALLGRFLARHFGQPSVLGELLMGIVAGNLLYLFGVDLVLILREGTAVFDIIELVMQGWPLEQAVPQVLGPGEDRAELLRVLRGPDASELIQIAHVVDVFSRYGVIFLLFLVGLQSSLGELSKSGPSSARVALIGVGAPMILGYLATGLLIPDLATTGKLFIAATLSATSVGITAAVLSELGKLHSGEARVIMGAAMMDDVMGLVSLAIVTGIVVEGGIDATGIASILLWTSVFLVGAFYLGPLILQRLIPLTRHLRLMEAKLFVSFLFVMILAWFASLVGLATIVGAFAAGLILRDSYFKQWGDGNRRMRIKDLVEPLEAIWVPIFFLLIGIQVKLEAFTDPQVLTVAIILTIVAIAGKLAAGLGAAGKLNRFAIGIGMVPRGEVCLVFATLGKTLGVLSDQLFSALVLMVMITALLAPPLLKKSLQRS